MKYVILLLGIGLFVVLVLILIQIRVFRKTGKNKKQLNKNAPPAGIAHPTNASFKRCPACGSTYTDASLLYCLSDGTALETGGESSGEAKTVAFRPR